ncbi:hypothetical protein PoB_004237200 [Plakobranchus ocellatus]|uniref:Uncharacterized protein n=1 Tax=Plakobranchus ocellatus TaxID=259542 RepID=A0AAV4B9J9_9GAST|nr:hypothetical protein PoB_004237200 [Plakobranchus ocellatus]
MFVGTLCYKFQPTSRDLRGPITCGQQSESVKLASYALCPMPDLWGWTQSPAALSGNADILDSSRFLPG